MYVGDSSSIFACHFFFVSTTLEWSLEGALIKILWDVLFSPYKLLPSYFCHHHKYSFGGLSSNKLLYRKFDNKQCFQCFVTRGGGGTTSTMCQFYHLLNLFMGVANEDNLLTAMFRILPSTNSILTPVQNFDLPALEGAQT